MGETMKINSKKVAELERKTSFSYRKCEKILNECDNDEQVAYERLMQMKNSPMEIMADSFVALLSGERGNKLFVYDKNKMLLSFPAIFPILFLVIFDVPSWIIGAFLIFIMLFHMDIRIESVSRKDKSKIKTVNVTDYQKQKTGPIPYTTNSVAEEDSGFHEITIE